MPSDPVLCVLIDQRGQEEKRVLHFHRVPCEGEWVQVDGVWMVVRGAPEWVPVEGAMNLYRSQVRLSYQPRGG